MIRTLAEQTVTYATPGGQLEATISAEWNGGCYVELTFTGTQPTEVINVWDDEHDRPSIERTPEALAAALEAWIGDHDSEELAWRLSGYDGDDREEVAAQWTARPERAWLFDYISNA